MQAFSRDVISAFSQTRVIFHVPHLGHFGMLCTSSHNDRNASDPLVVAADDLRIMLFTAEPGTEDAERLALATVLGTQSLID
jgi:hypothetical protein